MNDLEQFSLLLADVGPNYDDVQQIDVVSEDTWAVFFSDQAAVEIHYDTIGHAVSFTMPIGQVSNENREQQYELMLSFNFLKRDTGGFHLAIDGENGDAWLMLDIHRTDVDGDALIGILDTILDAGTSWRRILSGELPADSDELSLGGVGMAAGAIRV